MKVKIFYTRQPGDSPAPSTVLGDGSQTSAIASAAGKGRVSRGSISEGLGENVAAKLAQAVCLISGPQGDVSVCLC